MYSKTSLYSSTPRTQNGLGLLSYNKIPEVSTDVVYKIKPQYNYRPDLLASDLYDDPNLWWVFKSRNPSVIEDPIFDFVAGVIIQVPRIETIKKVLGV